MNDPLEVQCSVTLETGQEAHQQGQPGQAVHPEGLKGIGGCFLGPVMPDQPKGTEGGDLEEKIEEAEVVGQDHPIHGPQKKNERRKETVPLGFF